MAVCLAGAVWAEPKLSVCEADECADVCADGAELVVGVAASSSPCGY